MARKLRITVQRSEQAKLTAYAELNDSSTASLIWHALPIASTASIWGDEVYFSVPVQAELENPQETVGIGDLGYWPQGPALCIFFGPTPISSPGEIRPASAVDVVGMLLGDPEEFRLVKTGDVLKLEGVEDNG